MYNGRMLIHLAPYLKQRRINEFKRLSRFFRQQGCTYFEAARFAKQTLSFPPFCKAQVIPYGPPSNLPH